MKKPDLMGDAVATAIRNRILTGEVHYGQVLRLAPLAAELDMSITPVREALLRLAQDGWVSHVPNRGFRVQPIHRDDVADTYFIWATVEGELAARATSKATQEGVHRLREVDQQLHDLNDHHGELAIELNSQLHAQVHAMASAPKLLWFASAARRHVPLHLDAAFYSVPGWKEINRYGHTPIIDAVAEGDGARAQALMADHFRSTGDLLLTWLDSLDFWADPEGTA